MLVIRCVIPMILLTLPIITLGLMVFLDVRYNWNFYSLLYGTIMIHGTINTIGTLVVFKPYRDGFTKWFRKAKNTGSSVLTLTFDRRKTL